MKVWLWIGAALAAVLGILLLFKASPNRPAPEPVSRSASPAAQPTETPRPSSVPSNALFIAIPTSQESALEILPAAPAEQTAHPAESGAAMSELTGIEPAMVLENMRTSVRHYASVFGSNPVGTNPEITKALNGGNPKQTRFVSDDSGLRINSRGELVDSWGTPFFFHQLAARDMEIHSAGPDRTMWTADDMVIR
jgi:hypothetical protein